MLVYLSDIDRLSFSSDKTYDLREGCWLAECDIRSGSLIGSQDAIDIINLWLENVAVQSETVCWLLRTVCLVDDSTEAIGTDHLVGVIKSKDITDILNRLSILIFAHI